VILSALFTDLGMGVSEPYFHAYSAQSQRKDLLESLAGLLHDHIPTGRQLNAQSLVGLANACGYPSVTVADVLEATLLPWMINEFTVHESTLKSGSYRIQKKDTYL
jgi:hypothetical protein